MTGVDFMFFALVLLCLIVLSLISIVAELRRRIARLENPDSKEDA